MPKDYAKRFAELIAADPDVASDYVVQLYSVEFAKEVAAELTRMGFEPEVTMNGLLKLHVPDDHPKAKERKSRLGLNWPKKPDNRSTEWSPSHLRLAF